KLNTAAANKLLKIIEEPPDQTMFFLVTNNYELVIPTLLSRTQLVRLGRLTDEEITSALMHRHGLARPAAQKIAHRSGGDYNEAFNLVLHHDEELNLNQRFLDWMRACLKLNLA